MQSIPTFFKASILALVVLNSACSKESQPPIPKWFDKDAVFSYECREIDTSVVSLVRLTTRNLGSRVEFRQSLAEPELTLRGTYFESIGDARFIKKEDGLYTSAQAVCGMGLINTTFDFLNIPANPSTGRAVQLYTCERQLAGQNQILNADTVLIVPAGTFHTFCILHPDSNRSYWNRDIGIIQYELYEQKRNAPSRLFATLKLQRVQ